MISSAGRAAPLQGVGRQFDPVIIYGGVAQLVEQALDKGQVTGSSPVTTTNALFVYRLGHQVFNLRRGVQFSYSVPMPR